MKLEELDRDGALGEALETLHGSTRGAFLRRAVVGSGALLAASAVPASAAVGRRDTAILNYALTLEYLETAFYREAAGSGALSGDALAFAQLVAAHEQTHVNAIKAVLKSLRAKAVARPTFNFQGTNTDQAKFIPTALLLENTGVRAYHGQVPRIKSKAILTAAAQIATVEARHAAAVAVLAAQAPFADGTDTSITPLGAFDKGLSMKKILAAVGQTGFIEG